MKIAIIGGTGDIGEGLALRWGLDTDHDIYIGSRSAEKAKEAVVTYRKTLQTHGATGIDSFSGRENREAAAGADIVVLAVPPDYVEDILDDIEPSLEDTILISPVVQMSRDDDEFHHAPPSPGSTSEFIDHHTPPEISVIGAFHNIAAGRMASLDERLDSDVPVLGDDQVAKETVIELTNEIGGIRALDAGGLANAREVEAITPLLINLARHNSGLHDLGIKFV